MDESDAGPERKRGPGLPALAGRPARITTAIALLLVASVSATGQPESRGAAPDLSRLTGSLIAVGVLILINGLFAMTEAAFLTVRRTRIEQLVDEGNRRARIAAQLLNEPTRTLSTIQVGITFVSLLSAGAAADAAVEPLARWLRALLPGSVLSTYAGPLAFLSIMVGVSFFTLVLGEITPKSLAVHRAEPIVLATAYPLRALQTLSSPVVTVLTRVSDFFVRPFGGKATFHPMAMSEEELKLMVEQSEEFGVIERQEKEMIHSIFDFGDTPVRRVMTPRLDITAVSADASLGDLIDAVKLSGHSRLPVFEHDLDQIVGVVHVKDVIDHIAEPGIGSVREYMRPPYFIPENKRVDDLLADFRGHKSHLAIVRDEYGTVTGIVSIEDILEEIVGDIQDEYDLEEPEMSQVDARTSLADGRMPLGDFNERMGTDIPTEEADTLGGFVFGLLGHQPERGEETSWNGLRFTVEATDGRRLQKVLVTRIEGPLPAADGAGSDQRADNASPHGSGSREEGT